MILDKIRQIEFNKEIVQKFTENYNNITSNTEVLGETGKTKCNRQNGTNYKLLDRPSKLKCDQKITPEVIGRNP